MSALNIRLLALPTLVALALLNCRSSAPAPVADTVIALPSLEQSAGLSPEVRLRKLHLVRPDLIPYPIQLDIYC